MRRLVFVRQSTNYFAGTTCLDSSTLRMKSRGFGPSLALGEVVMLLEPSTEGFGCLNLSLLAGDKSHPSLQAAIARAITSRAKTISGKRWTENGTPYSRQVNIHRRSWYNGSYQGGKIDDICVLCVIVLEVSSTYQFLLVARSLTNTLVSSCRIQSKMCPSVMPSSQTSSEYNFKSI